MKPEILTQSQDVFVRVHKTPLKSQVIFTDSRGEMKQYIIRKSVVDTLPILKPCGTEFCKTPREQDIIRNIEYFSGLKIGKVTIL